FSNQTRARGAGYYMSGAVRIEHGSESEVEARVQGARLYYVDMTCENDELNMWCDCPYFESTGPCKHLWAVILAADARGYLSAASRLDRKSVVYDYGDEDLGDEEEVYTPAADGYKSAPVVPITRPQPKPPGWREHLKEVAETAPAPRENWPAGRELLYVVDVPASRTRGLILKLMTREPKKTGGW